MHDQKEFSSGTIFDMLLTAVVSLLGITAASAGTIVASTDDRNSYISNAIAWFEDSESKISTRDMFNGPKNPYDLETFQTFECDFVQPDPADPIGGTTPKFMCEFKYNGDKVQVKVKYDQQYNSVWNWGRGNQEVYTSIVSQRILWALGFGADQSIPVTVKCKGCPVEPWTYVQVVQGYVNEDVAPGWIDMQLIKTGNWNVTVDEAVFSSAIVYLKFDEYKDGDEIDYLDTAGVQQRGYFWPEMYANPTDDHTQVVARDALSVIAAFLSYCDNFDGNQGFICLDDNEKKEDSSSVEKTSAEAPLKSKTTCEGTPMLYIHDVGGTLGYGWNLRHKNFWPNYMDLQQWLEVSMWGNADKCEVYVNGIPGCSWRGNLQVSEEGRAMAARLLSQLTDQQITDVFTAARANLMRNDSISDWVAGFKDKLQREVVGTTCTTSVKA